MFWFLLGLAALFVLTLLMRWFMDTPAREVTRAFYALALGGVGVASIILIIMGRVGPAIALAIVAGGWLLRQLLRGKLMPHKGGRAASSGKMTHAEALSVLGLEGDPDEAAINAAYHRLIKKIHPDQGGSAHLAAQINEAREVLLRAGKGG